MAHGMTLKKETGELVLRDPTKKAVLTPFDDLKKAVAEVEAGTFIPDRENDELTKALGNPEKGGRTRGYGGIPWKKGFHEDDHTSRIRARATKRREQQVADRLKKVEERNELLFAMYSKMQEKFSSRLEGDQI